MKWLRIAVTLGLLIVSAKTLEGATAKPPKSIKIYLPSQILVCYEGDKEVYRTRCSTGRLWGYKGKTKYRSVYHVLSKDPRGAKARSVKRGKGGYNASTPWKIRLCDEPKHLVRIHDFISVPKRPASHGCVRVPKGKGKWIYDWVNVGTPVYFTLEKAPKKTPKVPSPKPKSSAADHRPAAIFTLH